MVKVNPDDLFKARKWEDFLRRRLDAEIGNFKNENREFNNMKTERNQD